MESKINATEMRFLGKIENNTRKGRKNESFRRQLGTRPMGKIIKKRKLG